jgi:hypothetical protein
MAKSKKLEDAYRFPGFRPLPTIRGVFGDSSARIITLIRRGKKRRAAPAGFSTTDFMTGKPDLYETFLAEGIVSFWKWRFAALIAGVVAW